MAEKQLGVLKALDVAKTQLYHFTAIVIAGMGFFTDAYDLFCVSLVTKLLGRIYYFNPTSAKPGSLPPHVAAAVNGVALCGTLSGQLFFGWLGDKLGRKKVYGLTLLVAKNIKQATADMSKVLHTDLEVEERAEDFVKDPRQNYGLFSKEFLRRHGLHLLGTTSTWFLLDIAFYSQNLFQKDIFSAIGWIPKPATMNATHEVFRIARAQTLIALCSTVPGYWFTVAFIDIIGRFAIQPMGFFMMTVFMFAIAFPYNHWTKPENRIGFVVMYALTFFFANFGPNATTFIVPAEIFPARLWSTCHGISAAAGKAGAIIGAFGFLYAAQSQDKAKVDAGYPPGIGVKNSLIVLGVLNFIGMLFTFLVPEPKGKSLEELSGEAEVSHDEKLLYIL
ncbi:probable inorganic phosphate transporter 1-2 [Arabidopsis lyrata subsp. lyrata]|uniref:probable inorganic phosphate transporter 1-2 n=1 Tax=Arabidopsis lyrata subsp. lyrata TaxID=81972 RepID=UPI000A29B11E|nr:probable inorganic phosphate transporter 1-2 [Arabidopsis lyrata subsp. lyrata]|eukprot:XP_020888085.1 probable inorganic phosphate transporter 1-2 [Arabidopsis lyrata subsp. lyrata]